MFKYIFVIFLIFHTAHAYSMSCAWSLGERKNVNHLTQKLSAEFSIPHRYQGKTLRIKKNNFNIYLTAEGFQVKPKLFKKKKEQNPSLNKSEYLDLKIKILNELLKRISKSPLRLFSPKYLVVDTLRPDKAYLEKTELGLQVYDEIMLLKQELDHPTAQPDSAIKKILGYTGFTAFNLIGLPTLFSSRLTTDSKYLHTRKYFKVKTAIQIAQRMALRASIGLAIFVISSNIEKTQDFIENETQSMNEVLQNPEFKQMMKDLSEGNFYKSIDEKKSDQMVLLSTYKSFIETAPDKNSIYYDEYVSVAKELRAELISNNIDQGLIPQM